MSASLQPFGGETTDGERTLGLAAHLATFVIPLIGPLAIYVFKKDESRFLAYHAVQAGIFQLIVALAGTVTCGVGFVLLVLPIWVGLKAHKGEWAGYPLIDGFGRGD